MSHRKINSEQAHSVALSVFSALTEDGGRLSRFLNISGLTPDTIRNAASEPGFLPGIMDYVASDEALLLQIAKELDTKPEDIMAARWALSPSEFE